MNAEMKEMLAKLTLEEKAALCSGADFWHTKAAEKLGLPQIMMCDGPHGLRKQEGEGDHLGINDSIRTVCYPSASALAASFDTEVLEALGEVLGEECQAENVGMLLGPGLNMKRSPLCGRNFEYFSEDPYLAGKLGAAYIRGLQGKGISACVKHFAANNQEAHRMSSTSNMDDRTLREIYLPAFETAVKEGKTRSIMCAYNAVNGTYCSENRMLLTEILRNEWGFDGFVVTDWGGGKDEGKGVKAGLDLVMPGGFGNHEENLAQAVREGSVTEEELDTAAANVLRFMCDAVRLHVPGAEVDREKCAEVSENLALSCAVLLKNDGALPLKKTAKAAWIGPYAKQPRYQGSGSSHINTGKVAGAWDAASDVQVSYAKGYDIGMTQTDEVLKAEALKAASEADVAVIFAGLPDTFESEGFDRDTLELPKNQNELIEAVAGVQKNVVVVLHGGSPMMLPWIDRVNAVLCMYLGGQEVGSATAKLLYGEENPGGKLAETWPLKLEDNPSYLNFPDTDGVVEYHEGIYIGYRYYDKKHMEVLFPFGHGLSYTKFSYSGLQMDKKKLTDQETMEVSCCVKNTGNCRGREAVQLYVRDVESSVGRPLRELKGFAKVELEPGEEKEIRFTLDKRSFAYYEPKVQDWFVESGEFQIEIGASSRDIRLSESVYVEGTIRFPIHYTVNSPMSALVKTEKGKEVYKKLMDLAGSKQEISSTSDALGDAAQKMQESMFWEMPVNALVGLGRISQEELEEVIQGLNE